MFWPLGTSCLDVFAQGLSVKIRFWRRLQGLIGKFFYGSYDKCLFEASMHDLGSNTPNSLSLSSAQIYIHASSYTPDLIISAAFSAMAYVGWQVLPPGSEGMMLESTTRRLSTP